MRVLAVDPGDHGGWCFHDDDGLCGGTLPKSYTAYHDLFVWANPDCVVIESFQLYAGKAQSQIGQSFFTCEVIGILKMLCDLHNIPYVMQPAANKKYIPQGRYMEYVEICAPSDEVLVHPDFATARRRGVSEHTRDAIRHLVFYEHHTSMKNLHKDAV